MNDKVEWEVVDGESPGATGGNRPPPRPPTPQELLRAALGPWWRWKLAGGFILGAVALVFVAAMAGVVVVTAIAFALLMFAVARVRSWVRGSSSLPDRHR